MKLEDLDRDLVAEGFGPLIHERGAWGLAVGDLMIVGRNGLFHVGVTERGQMGVTSLSTADEDEACRYFHERALGQFWNGATFTEAAAADALQSLLEGEGVDVIRNDIPHFNGPDDARYRLFVHGRDLERVRALTRHA